MTYGSPIELSDASPSGWANALQCPHCSGTTLRFMDEPRFHKRCPPTDDKAMYIDLYCTSLCCEGTAALVVRQHAGIIHLSLIVSSTEPPTN